MSGLDRRQELAALSGWAVNPAVPLQERYEAAIQVIEGLEQILDEQDEALAEYRKQVKQ